MFFAAIFNVYVEHTTRYICVFHLPSILIPVRPVMSFDQIRVQNQVFGERKRYFLDAVFVTICLYKIMNPLEERGFENIECCLKGLEKLN